MAATKAAAAAVQVAMVAPAMRAAILVKNVEGLLVLDKAMMGPIAGIDDEYPNRASTASCVT